MDLHASRPDSQALAHLPASTAAHILSLLEADEQVLWAGPRNARAALRRSLLPGVFGLVFTAGGIAALVATYQHFGPRGSYFPIVVTSMFMCVWLLISLVLMLAPFLSFRMARQSAEVVTNHRAFITYGTSTSVSAFPHNSPEELLVRYHRSGRRDILFRRRRGRDSRGRRASNWVEEGFFALPTGTDAEIKLRLARRAVRPTPAMTGSPAAALDLPPAAAQVLSNTLLPGEAVWWSAPVHVQQVWGAQLPALAFAVFGLLVTVSIFLWVILGVGFATTFDALFIGLVASPLLLLPLSAIVSLLRKRLIIQNSGYAITQYRSLVLSPGDAVTLREVHHHNLKLTVRKRSEPSTMDLGHDVTLTPDRNGNRALQLLTELAVHNDAQGK